jgi:translation elongation factor EF-1alpha
MLLGLGQVTHEEVDRLGQTALMRGKGSFKYAWCSDRTLEERERGLSTCACIRPSLQSLLSAQGSDTFAYARARAAINWSVRECTLASCREIEIVDVPGHRDFTKNVFVVRISRACVRVCVCHADAQ